MSSIYAKLARIQNELMNTKIPKTGVNKFQKFKYHELEDLVPPIFKACFKEEITLFFTFTNNEGVLHLKSWEKEGKVGTRDELTVRAPLPPISIESNNNQAIQDTGKYITYIKRYLLMNTFLIMEKEVADAEGGFVGNKSNNKPSKKAAAKKEEAKTKKTATKKEATKTFSPTSIPKPIRDASRLCKKSYGNITEKGIIEKLSELRAKGKLTPKMAKHWADYTRDNSQDIVKELAA